MVVSVKNPTDHRSSDLERCYTDIAAALRHCVCCTTRGVDFVFKKAVNRYVLMTSLELDKNDLRSKRDSFWESHKDRCENFFVKTAKEIQIDTFVIYNPDQKDLSKGEQKWIIYFEGMRGAYELELEWYRFLSDDLGVNFCVFNYPGVGSSESEPNGSDDLIFAGKAVVQELLRRGMLAKNCFLHGYSFGGGVAAKIAADYADDKSFFTLFMDRSFCSFDQEVKDLVGVSFIRDLMARWMRAIGWHFENAENYLRISKERRCLAFCKEDAIVLHSASVYKELKKRQSFSCLEEREAECIRVKLAGPFSDIGKESHLALWNRDMGESYEKYKTKVKSLLGL